MRHEAAGVTSEAFRRSCAWAVWTAWPTTCTSRRRARRPDRHCAALRAQSGREERAEGWCPACWASEGPDLLKSLHQKPCAASTPLSDFVARFIELSAFGQGGLLDVLLKAVGAHPACRAAQRLQLGGNCSRTCS